MSDFPVAIPVVAVASPANFCPKCGSAWLPEWTNCESCINRSVLSSEQGQDLGGRGLFSAIALYFVFLGSNFAAGIFAYVVHGEGDDAEVLSTFISVGMNTTIVLAWLVAWRNEVRPALVKLGSGKWYFCAVAMGCVTFVIAHAAVTGLVRLLEAESVVYSDSFVALGYGWWPVILVVSVYAAIVEELAFRGVIYSALQRVLDTKEVILVSSLMFMVIHLAVPSFPHLLLIGLALGFLRWRSGSIYPCMLLHFTHNSLTLAAEYYGW